MKQKIKKVNWYILAFIFAVELIVLNIQLGQYDISLYSNTYSWIRTNLIVFAFDIVYILYIFDILTKKKEIKNILDTYKADVNLKFIKNFKFIEIIKLILILLSTSQTTIFSNYSYRYINIITTFICVTIAFYILYAVMSKRDNIKRKLRRLKKDIKVGKTDLNFILIAGNSTPSTFDLVNIPNYKIGKNNLYINLYAELPEIVKYNEKAKDLILNNTIAMIHELNDSKKILEEYEKQTINNFHMYHVMAIKNLKDITSKNNFNHINAIKLCDLENDIQFTENLVAIEIEDIVKKSECKKALNKVKNGCKTDESYTKNLETIYKYNFNNRLKDNVRDVPKDKYLFELYRNAYLNKSPHQSILTFFNYITVIGRLVEYYLYAKYNDKFNENEIDNYRIGDNPSMWNSNILINIYRNQDNVLYKNLREKKYELSNDERILVKYYLGNMIDTEIKGDKLTYDGMMDLFIAFRNKVEAHGILNDANVYAVWNITRFFANMLNKIYMISDLELEYNYSDIEVKVGYKGEKKVGLGKYVIMYEKYLCFVKDKDDYKYINYFAGEVKPSFIAK